MQIEAKILETVNQPGRVGILATASTDGQPNAAYFGTPQLKADGSLIVGLGNNRSLANLEQNPLAAFFMVEKAPVEFTTPGFRLYLKVSEIQRQGPVLDGIRQAIAAKAGEKASQMIQAGVVFQVTDIRPLVDQG